MNISFSAIYSLLREWFDEPTPACENFENWRHQTYRELESGKRKNLPLKTWWPKYTEGDFRLELVIGALLVQQIRWPSVKRCIENLSQFLKENGKPFALEGLLSIPEEKLEELIRACRYKKQKSLRILNFCGFVKGNYGSIGRFFENREVGELGNQLSNLKAGFGSETRDCVLLYAANLPVFIADAYSRKLLNILNVATGDDYDECRATWEEGIGRDFNRAQLDSIAEEYTDAELNYALCNKPAHRDVALVLLYQQLHAGIVELGISGRWDEFRSKLQAASAYRTVKEGI